MIIKNTLGNNDRILSDGTKIRIIKKGDKLPVPCKIIGDYNYSPIMGCLVCVVIYKGMD